MRFLSAFQVPNVARPVIGRIVDAADVALVEALAAAGRAPESEFDVEDASAALSAASGSAGPAPSVPQLLERAYRRGVLDLADDTRARYRVASFYDRLGVFVISQPDEYLALPAETRTALDAWFFAEYASRLDPGPTPTSDRVVTLDAALAHIDAEERPIWLNRCDCRTLAGRCELPVDTCVSFRNGINTLSDRGWSTQLTKDAAKAVVVRASADGLVHTLNDGGLCNCCSDCCYLYRAQRARGQGLVWPAAAQIAAFSEDECTGCELCVTRCPFDAFTNAGGGVVFDPERCRGCGLCAETCPTVAISMNRRVRP